MTNISSKTNFYPDVLADFQIHTDENAYKYLLKSPDQFIPNLFAETPMQAQVSLWFMYLTSINTTYNIKINKNNVILFHSERTKLVTYYCIRLEKKKKKNTIKYQLTVF
jgi:hypothetical protein